MPRWRAHVAPRAQSMPTESSAIDSVATVVVGACSAVEIRGVTMRHDDSNHASAHPDHRHPRQPDADRRPRRAHRRTCRAHPRRFRLSCTTRRPRRSCALGEPRTIAAALQPVIRLAAASGPYRTRARYGAARLSRRSPRFIAPSPGIRTERATALGCPPRALRAGVREIAGTRIARTSRLFDSGDAPARMYTSLHQAGPGSESRPAAWSLKP